MAKQEEGKPRNIRYSRQGRHDEALRAKAQQLFSSQMMSRPAVARNNGRANSTTANELNSKRFFQERNYSDTAAGNYSKSTDFNNRKEEMYAFRKRTENIIAGQDNARVSLRSVPNGRPVEVRPSSSSKTIQKIPSKENGEDGSYDSHGKRVINHESKQHGKKLNVYNSETIDDNPQKRESIPDEHNDEFEDVKGNYGAVNAVINIEKGQINDRNCGEVRQTEQSVNLDSINGNSSDFKERKGNLAKKSCSNSRGGQTEQENKRVKVSFKEINMDEDKQKAKKLEIQEKVISFRRKSIENLLEEDFDDVTPQVQDRTLSQVSRDLMKSKEELINRSKQCGLMLKQYRKRDEEKREISAVANTANLNNNNNNSARVAGSKHSSLGRENVGPKYPSTTSASSFEEEFPQDFAQPDKPLRKLSLQQQQQQQTKSLSDRPSSSSEVVAAPHSPRLTKQRKSSYIDSWLQSQQNRISSLVSAIKEDPDTAEEDNAPAGNRIQEQKTIEIKIQELRDRSSSMPQDSSSAFLSWGRRSDDSSSFDGDDSASSRGIPIQHTRSASGEEILGVVAIPQAVTRSAPNTRLPSRGESPADSPMLCSRNQQGGGAFLRQHPQQQQQHQTFADELRSTARHSMNMLQRRRFEVAQQSLNLKRRKSSETRLLQDGTAISNNTTVCTGEVINQDGKVNRVIKIEKNTEQKKKFVPTNVEPKLKKETTFDTEVTTNIVPAIETSVKGLGATPTRRSMSPRTSSSSIVVSPRSFDPPGPVDPPVTPPDSGKFPANTHQSSPSPRNQQELGENEAASFENVTGVTPPFSNGRILQERHANCGIEGSRHSFPVAVVKPLQHAKSQSYDSSTSDSSFDRGRKVSTPELKSGLAASRTSMSTDLDELMNYGKPGMADSECAPSQQTIANFNMRRSCEYDGPGYSDAPSQGNNRQRSNSSVCGSQLSKRDADEDNISERAVDVGPGNSQSNGPRFIMQEFQWYSAPKSRNTFATQQKSDSLPQQNTKDLTRGKLERMSKFKRGSKLLESKYSSFSKSLENLSKIGKEKIKLMKNRSSTTTTDKSPSTITNRSSPKVDRNEESDDEIIRGETNLVGDLALNEEFARKMERRSQRLSMDASGLGITSDDNTCDDGGGVKRRLEPSPVGNMGARPKSVAVMDATRRFPDANQATTHNGAKTRSGLETRFGDSEFEARRRIGESPRNAKQVDKIMIGFPENGVDKDSQTTHAMMSQNGGAAKHIVVDVTAEEWRGMDSRQMNRRYDVTGKQRDHSGVAVQESNGALGNVDQQQQFVDYDDDDDEQEMVQIARKISTLRSSQYNIRRNDHRCDGAGDNVTSSTVTSRDGLKSEDGCLETVGSSSVTTERSTRGNVALGGNATSKNSVTSNDNRTSDNVTSKSSVMSKDDKTSDNVTSTGKKTLLEVASTLDENDISQNKDDEGGHGVSGNISKDESTAVKRISNSLSRVMTDLRELREQDMTLASQLLGLGKSIKHFKKQKKEMEANLSAILDNGDYDDDDDYDDSSGEEY